MTRVEFENMGFGINMKSKLEALEKEIWADRKHRRIKKIKAAFSAYTLGRVPWWKRLYKKDR